MPGPGSSLALVVDGRDVELPDDGGSLLDVLRERLGVRTLKDGCSPQGQCGCCTVLIDGQPRVACVTPARRVRGRSITTVDGLDSTERAAWGQAFCATGASQCGFCTPGIVMRLAGLRAKGIATDDHGAVEQALLAHLCRCTGWRTILDAWSAYGAPATASADPPARDLDAASRRATLEGRTPQRVDPVVPLGHGGFADDTAPADALVAVPDGAGAWAVGESLAEARAAAGKAQGRRTTAELRHPIDLPPGDWDVTLRTTWVEPAYLEIDASWCVPGGEPASPLANGGAFGGKLATVVTGAARELAARHGRPVRVLLAREDAVRLGGKRPPIAAGIFADGSGVIRVARTAGPRHLPRFHGRSGRGSGQQGIAEAIASVAPGLAVDHVDVPGPPTSPAPRAAGWAEALVVLAAARVRVDTGAQVPGVLEAEGANGRACVAVRSPDGAVARADVVLGAEPRVRVAVGCGDPLDEVALRSYCVGAAHMALGWVCSEGLAVDEAGDVHDLTIRSFGVLRALDTPPIDVTIEPSHDPPVNGSDAAFAAVAAAAWLAQDCPPAWPTGHRLRRAH
jgi:xanthine dehydrogenase small subunit